VSELGVWIALSAGKLCGVPDLVKGPFVFRVRFIHPIGVLDSVIVHDREAVDIGLLGDGAGFRGADANLCVRCREAERRERGNRTDKASSCKRFHDSSPLFRHSLPDVPNWLRALSPVASMNPHQPAGLRAPLSSANIDASQGRFRHSAPATNWILCRRRANLFGYTA
jgi:hypothetical protein